MDFQVVIFRYMEDVSWVENLDNVIIYNKGNRIKSKHPVINLPNVGMGGGSLFYHLVKNYDNIADVTFLVEANPWDGDFEVSKGIKDTPEGLKKLIDYYKYIPEGEFASVPTRYQIIDNMYQQPVNWNQRHHEYFIKFTHTWQEFLDDFIDPKRIIDWKLPTRFYRNGHIAVTREAILSNPKNYYIKLLQYWKYDVPCFEWYVESVFGLVFNVGNDGKLINLHHDTIDYSNLDDYTKWVYEIE